ncbi:MAG: hypothetical protein ACTSU6_02595 [Candidatus Njordarchaeales archaeon]
MCIICVELLRQKLSIPEASKNAREMLSGAKNNEEFWHYEDLLEAMDNDDFDKLDKILEEQDV